MKTQNIVQIALCLITAGCAGPAVDPNIDGAIGRCIYVNGFSDRLECVEYLGSNWTDAAIAEHCDSPVPGSDPGTYEAGLACDRGAILGQCFIDAGTVESSTIVFPGNPGDSCSGLSMGCGFAGGDYVPAAACGGEDPPLDTGPAQPFTPFEQVCVDPLPGSEPGQGPDGQVCTWEAISAATEPGRRYTDYASCEPVWTQRPYWAMDTPANTAPDDPRYDDEAYMADFAWATEQLQASACTCCHTQADSPDGRPSGWAIDAPGLWTDSFSDEGLAMMAGWIDSTAFGAFDAADNNGFHRDRTGVPTTDPERMQGFLFGELMRRGLTASDFEDSKAFGGPLTDQLVYQPEACDEGIGLDADGRLQWRRGTSRYLYVLEAGAENPGVPPNLDLPEGTIWRLDVQPGAAPIEPGLRFGEVPAGAAQAYPATDAPAPLVSGQSYYLYVLMDIALPVERCLFVAP